MEKWGCSSDGQSNGFRSNHHGLQIKLSSMADNEKSSEPAHLSGTGIAD
jgi:hypothetical protein